MREQEPPRRLRPAGDEEALLYVLQIVVGGAAAFAVAAVVENRALVTLLGFFVMCLAAFPFARRTWAADIRPLRYFAGALFGATIAAGLRIVTQ